MGESSLVDWWSRAYWWIEELMEGEEACGLYI